MYVQLWLYNWAAGSKFEWQTFLLGKHRDLVSGCLSLRCFYHNAISSVQVLRIIDAKNVFYVFYYFYKNAFFNVFLFFERFLFSSGEIFYPTKPLKSY